VCFATIPSSQAAVFPGLHLKIACASSFKVNGSFECAKKAGLLPYPDVQLIFQASGFTRDAVNLLALPLPAVKRL